MHTTVRPRQRRENQFFISTLSRPLVVFFSISNRKIYEYFPSCMRRINIDGLLLRSSYLHSITYISFRRVNCCGRKVTNKFKWRTKRIALLQVLYIILKNSTSTRTHWRTPFTVRSSKKSFLLCLFACVCEFRSPNCCWMRFLSILFMWSKYALCWFHAGPVFVFSVDRGSLSITTPPRWWRRRRRRRRRR